MCQSTVYRFNMNDTLANIPDELVDLTQWCVWRFEKTASGRVTKIPYNANTGMLASSTNESTWADFDTAQEVMPQYDGLGFFFKPPYIGIDLDDVMNDIVRFQDDDDTDNIVSDFINTMNTYAEVSPSGAGVHLILKGELPPGGRRKGNVEMYDHGRFFTMTGKRISRNRYVTEDVEGKIRYLHSKYIGSQELPREYMPQSTEGNSLSPAEVIDHATESKNGLRFKLFIEGGWDQFYSSQSEADMAFANDLAFWTGRDINKMDTIFRQSSLFRPKWDEYRGEDTYGMITLNKAIRDCKNVYSPNLGDYNITIGGLTKSGNQLFSYDDTGNAQRIFTKYGRMIRYSYVNKEWFYYTQSGVWVEDETGMLKRLVDEIVNNMKFEPLITAEGLDEEEALKIQRKHIKASRNHTGKKNMLKETEHLVPIKPNEFDVDDFYFNAQNGYLNLTNGQLQEHDVERMFSKISYAEFTDKNDCPRWMQFLDEIFLGDRELIHYIQKAVGYSLTGSTKEQCMFILYGNGRNGKSVFLDIMNAILGTYATNIQPQTIMVKQGTSSHTSDVARLSSARFVTTTEPNEGQRMDEGLIKQLTGGDVVTASFKYGAEFQFTPKFKIWMATNHKPIIRGRDDGIWRRMHLIPFNLKLPDEAVDRELKSKLIDELPAILNWAVQGALLWQAEKLGMPQAVKDATTDYRNEMDVVAGFIDDCCFLSPNTSVKAKDLYQAYRQWCHENETYIMSNPKFGTEMGNKDFERKRQSDGNYYVGIGLKPEHQPYSIDLSFN